MTKEALIKQKFDKPVASLQDLIREFPRMPKDEKCAKDVEYYLSRAHPKLTSIGRIQLEQHIFLLALELMKANKVKAVFSLVDLVARKKGEDPFTTAYKRELLEKALSWIFSRDEQKREQLIAHLINIGPSKSVSRNSAKSSTSPFVFECFHSISPKK